MNCHLAITRVKFVYLIGACVLRRKLNRRFHNKRRRRVVYAGCRFPEILYIYIYGVVISMFDFHRSDRGSNPNNLFFFWWKFHRPMQ